MLRLIINGIHIETTPAQIEKGIGDYEPVNQAVQEGYRTLTLMMADPAVRGLAGHWNGYNVQIDVVEDGPLPKYIFENGAEYNLPELLKLVDKIRNQDLENWVLNNVKAV